VGFFSALRGNQGVGGIGVFGEVDPSLGGVDGAVAPTRLDAGGDGEARYGVADHLALAAADAANGIAHEEDFAEVFGPEGGTAKLLSGAELALDSDAVIGVEAKVRSLVRRLASFSASAAWFELILEFHV
jgi:hypothetical protein